GGRAGGGLSRGRAGHLRAQRGRRAGAPAVERRRWGGVDVGEPDRERCMMRGRLHSADVRDAVMTEPPIGLARLEPRVLLSAFQYTPIVEAFDLERFVREIAAPEGVADGQRFGTRVIGMGDVDGDGVDDLAVSAPGFREPGVSGPWRGEAGAVF